MCVFVGDGRYSLLGQPLQYSLCPPHIMHGQSSYSSHQVQSDPHALSTRSWGQRNIKIRSPNSRSQKYSLQCCSMFSLKPKNAIKSDFRCCLLFVHRQFQVTARAYSPLVQAGSWGAKNVQMFKPPTERFYLHECKMTLQSDSNNNSVLFPGSRSHETRSKREKANA